MFCFSHPALRTNQFEHPAAYDRMYQKLKNGSRFERSFTSVVCEKDASGKCICPKMMNVLKDDRIIRIANGTQKPVYKVSEFLRNQAKVDPMGTSTLMNIDMNEVQCNAPNYVEYLKESNSWWSCSSATDAVPSTFTSS